MQDEVEADYLDELNYISDESRRSVMRYAVQLPSTRFNSAMSSLDIIDGTSVQMLLLLRSFHSSLYNSKGTPMNHARLGLSVHSKRDT